MQLEQPPLGKPAVDVARYMVDQLRKGIERKTHSVELLHGLDLVVERGWKHFVDKGVTEHNCHDVAAEIRRLLKEA